MTAVSIARTEVRYLALPTGMKSFVLPNGHRTPTELSTLLIRVTDSDGAVGQSLLWSQRDRQLPLFEAGLRYLGEVVEGWAVDAADLVPALRSSAAFLGTDGVMAFATSGLEMAVEDLVCRRTGLSLGRALGRRRDRVRAYQTGLMLPASIDELIVEALGIYERGLRAVKMLVGRPTIHEDVARVTAVRQALPDDASLMVDALQRWTLDEALDATERLADLDLVWVEDPINTADIAGYAELVKHSPVPIATGETCFAAPAFQDLLDAGISYVVAELERVGGIRQWMRIAKMVQEASAVMLPHVYPHISAQLLSAVEQDQIWLEYVPWFDSIITDAFEIVDGEIVVDDRPGSGFDPDPDAVERVAQTVWLPLAG